MAISGFFVCLNTSSEATGIPLFFRFITVAFIGSYEACIFSKTIASSSGQIVHTTILPQFLFVIMSFSSSGAKAQNNFLQGPNSAANSLVVEVNYLRNQSGINKATLEAQSALAKERTDHFQLKMQVKQQKALTDSFQGRIETLQTQRANLQSNKTTLGKADCTVTLYNVCICYSSQYI